ncbi:MAG: Sec-independent protein translocase protein TatB [Bradymonadia bacterium]
MSFFGLGFTELVVIAIVTLVVVGPKRLPAVARTLGQGIRMLRRAGQELRDAVDIDEVRDQIQRETREMWREAESILDVEPEPATQKPEKKAPDSEIAGEADAEPPMMTGPTPEVNLAKAADASATEGESAEEAQADTSGTYDHNAPVDDVAAPEAGKISLSEEIPTSEEARALEESAAPVARAEAPSIGPSAALKAALGEGAIDDDAGEGEAERGGAA